MISEFIFLVRENQSRGMRVAEIGCWSGETTVGYLPIIKENGGKVILVDWFKGNETAPYPGRHSYHPEKAMEVYERLMKVVAEYNNMVSVYWYQSHTAAKLIKDKSLDICFIDADHRYFNVLEDIDAWKPKVKPGGILCGHDFDEAGRGRVGKFSIKELETDFLGGIHCGVVQAVVDCFGVDFEVRGSTRQHPGIWIHRMGNTEINT